MGNDIKTAMTGFNVFSQSSPPPDATTGGTTNTTLPTDAGGTTGTGTTPSSSGPPVGGGGGMGNGGGVSSSGGNLDVELQKVVPVKPGSRRLVAQGRMRFAGVGRFGRAHVPFSRLTQVFSGKTQRLSGRPLGPAVGRGWHNTGIAKNVTPAAAAVRSSQQPGNNPSTRGQPLF